MWGVDEVSVTFGTSRRGSARAVRALRAVSLDLPPGVVQAVVGGDGAGKTTLLHVLVGRVIPLTGTVTAPEPRDIGFMPSTSGVWRELSVDENIDFVARAYSVPPAELARRRKELLGRAGLSAVRDRLGSQLSGGMRQKLGFCLAMLHAPHLLILDEPSTGVDPVSRGELWRMIAETAADGTAVLVATTYLDEAERASGVLVLDDGLMLFSGDPATVAHAVPGTISVRTIEGDHRPAATQEGASHNRSWRHGRTLRTWSPGALSTRDNPVHSVSGPADGEVIRPNLEDAVIALTLAHRTETEVTDLASAFPTIDQPLRPRSAARTWPVAAFDAGTPPNSNEHRTPMTPPFLVEVAGAVRRFGSFTALDGASLTVAPGEVVGLLGANGAGKTTLIRLLLGLEAPDAGVLRIFGEEPSRSTRSRLGYLPQGLGLYAELSVRQNVDFVAGAFRTNAPRPLPDALARVADDPVGRIGLGLQRRLAFHCALLHKPELLVLDEPTSGVDPLARARLWDTIHEQADSGVGVLVTTHYMHEAQQCDTLVLLSRGKVVGVGREVDIVAGERAIVVSGPPWSRLFAVLDAAGLAVTLAGTQVRVTGATRAMVEEVLAAAGVTATLDETAATLEERMSVLN